MPSGGQRTMQMLKIYWWIGLCWWTCLALHAQVDTTLSLPTHELQATSLRQSSLNNTTQTWTSTQLSASTATTIAELLQQEGSVYIKNYGAGSLSTSSIRGGSAGHTLVLWNGLPIHSPMLGLLDLSLLPTAVVEEVQVQKGGQSSAWGSGAVGGVIALHSKVTQDTTTQLAFRWQRGSFGQQQQSGKIELPLGRWRLSSRWTDQRATNDFQYQAAPTLPTTRQTNAQFRQRHWLSSLQGQLSEKQQVQLDVWHQSAYRQVPPTLTQTRSEAEQFDYANRLALTWQRLGDRNKWQAKTALFQEDLRFIDPLSVLVSDSEFRTWFHEGSLEQFWTTHHRSTMGATHSQTRAIAPGYADGQQEARFSIWGMHQWRTDRWQAQLNVRQSWIDGKRIPFTPSFSTSLQVTPIWKWSAKVSRNYRLPTLNDRFWQPGGNPDLQAEEGWSQEVNLFGQATVDLLRWKTQTNLFNRNITNWILWTPLPGQSFWSANNIAEVWSRGIEQQATIGWQQADWAIDWQLNYTFLRATHQVPRELPKIAAGTQLIYTPEHQGSAQLKGTWRDWSVHYQHQYVGAARGVNEDLAAFQTAQASIQYTTAWKTNTMRLFAHIYNIWDVDYLVVERRPMPGRNMSLGISCSFN
jgi:iron complex outermembrane receptor protein